MRGLSQLCGNDVRSYFRLTDTELEFREVCRFAGVTQRVAEPTRVFCSNLGRFALLGAGAQVLGTVL